jgi:peptide/nickel transport system permease protein
MERPQSGELALAGEHPGDAVAPVVAASSAQRSALRRLLRNRTALAFGLLFLAVLAVCLCAPLYSQHVAHTGPNAGKPTGNVTIDGEQRPILSDIGVPLSPTWHSQYFLGADQSGRDVAVRLLYGGLTSLKIGFLATLITMVLATLLGILAGYARGKTDFVLSLCFDVMWSYPVVLLGLALGTALTLGGLAIGPLEIAGNSLLIPALIIGFVAVPYVARPLRGRVMGLAAQEFVDAARIGGASHLRIMLSEILPNLASSILAFIPLILAQAILLEAGLSFLGAGVQPPNASWGTMMAEGIQLLPAAPYLTLAPGLMLLLAVLGVNVFGDGVREAVDVRSDQGPGV